MREEQTAPDRNAAAEVFAYPECSDAPFVPSWSGWDLDAEDSPASGQVQREGGRSAELEQQCAAEARRAFEAGRDRGREEGRNAERAAQAEALAAAGEQRARQAAELVAAFSEERARYFRAAEQEIVRLALAAAERILRREAQTDPLLLMGAVRAALGQVSRAAEVQLRVPAADLDLWTEAIALLPNLPEKPLVVAGKEMQAGDCRIETSLGRADLGVGSQLAEMERILLGGGAAAAPQASVAAQCDPRMETAV